MGFYSSTLIEDRGVVFEKRAVRFFVGVHLRDSLSRQIKSPASAAFRAVVLRTTALGVPLYGYRYLSTELGRWVNRDPIGEGGGNLLYGFVDNRTLDAFDAIGLATEGGCCCCCVEELVGMHGDLWSSFGFVVTFGQDLTFDVSLSYLKGEVSGDCKLKWYEYSNRPILGPPAIPGDSAPHLIENADELLPDWAERSKPCSGSEKITLKDHPYMVLRTSAAPTPGRPIYDWSHVVQVRIYSTPGCDCKFSSGDAWVSQHFFWTGTTTIEVVNEGGASMYY